MMQTDRYLRPHWWSSALITIEPFLGYVNSGASHTLCPASH